MEADLIYDVGMHNGDDTAYYLSKGYRVVAIEADPALVEAARRRFVAEIAADRLTILDVGVAEEEGEKEFWINEKKSVWNSFNKHVSARNNLPHHSIRVRCRRFGDILRAHGVPYYLKVDIEGNDRLCLEDLDASDLPVYVSVEVGPLDYLLKLRDLGYAGFKYIDQLSFRSLTVPPDRDYARFVSMKNKTSRLSRPGRLWAAGFFKRRLEAFSRRLRRQGDWQFPMGSTGPFGEDTPGPWQCWQEAAYSWLHYHRIYHSSRNHISYGFWCDLHARREV